MSDMSRFAFDTEFDRDGNVVAAPRPRPKTRFTAEEVEALKAEAYAAGQAGAEARAAEAAAAAMADFAQAAKAIVEGLGAQAHTLKVEAAELAVAVGDVLSGGLVAREPADPIRLLMSQAMDLLRDQPRVILRLSPDLHERLGAELTATAQRSGFTGELIVQADESVAAGDVALDWGSGGLARDTDAARERVREMLDDYLHAEEEVQGDLFAGL